MRPRWSLLVAILAGCGVGTPPPAIPTVSQERAEAIELETTVPPPAPLPAEYDPDDLGSTFRWIASRAAPSARSYARVRSATETAASKEQARADAYGRWDDLKKALAGTVGDEVRWEGVVRRAGPAGVEVEFPPADLDRATDADSRFDFDVVPARDHPPTGLIDDARILRVGLQIDGEHAGSLRAGDKIVVEGVIAEWDAFLDDADGNPGPNLRVYLKGSHARGHAKP